MKISETCLKGLYEIENKVFTDERGYFVKTFHHDVFQEYGLDVGFKESFYSRSKRNVIRGMHFQLPPHDHAKMVYVPEGEILDVAVDIRKNSPTYMQSFSLVLSKNNAKSMYISKGFAHGFLTLSEEATVVYLTTTVHNPKYDAGIRWDSFGFDWGVTKVIVSERDRNH